MKEIDFLPEWYRSSRRRQFGYRTQYFALAGMFVVMVVWNFASLNSISKATAELALIASRQAKAQHAAKEFTKTRKKVAELQKKVRVIEEIDSQIDVASVLAEMSFLIDEKIVLSKVELIAEKFLNKKQNQPNSGSIVRVAEANFNQGQGLPLGDVRFKVVIKGIASDASDTAELVCKLEDSPYFCLVYPSFSRNRTIETLDKFKIPAPGLRRDNPRLRESDVIPAKAGGGLRVSEFEISCYLANYRQGPRSAGTQGEP